TFPAGTLSGASKVRALEVIAELEPHSRGIYGGAVGYLDWRGQAELAITIRTGVLQGGLLHVQSGAGVVKDSVAEREWQETMDKSRMMLLAAELAERQSETARSGAAQQEATACI
ncbi:chorismate-binding protein, partial [Burkholderia glumae]